MTLWGPVRERDELIERAEVAEQAHETFRQAYVAAQATLDDYDRALRQIGSTDDLERIKQIVAEVLGKEQP